MSLYWGDTGWETDARVDLLCDACDRGLGEAPVHFSLQPFVDVLR